MGSGQRLGPLAFGRSMVYLVKDAGEFLHRGQKAEAMDRTRSELFNRGSSAMSRIMVDIVRNSPPLEDSLVRGHFLFFSQELDLRRFGALGHIDRTT
jgi:hypothetical protein